MAKKSKSNSKAQQRPMVVVAVPKSKVGKRKARGRKAPGPSRALVSTAGQDYIKCALNFMREHGGAKIPDGASLLTIAMDFKTAVNLKPLTADVTKRIAFVMYPGLPGSLIIYQGTVTTFTADGGQSVIDVDALGTGQPPVIVVFPDAKDPRVHTTKGTIYNARRITRARMVAYGMQVRPVGKILETSGRAAVVRMPISFSEGRLPVKLVGSTPYVPAPLAIAQCPMAREASWDPPDFSTCASYPDSKVCPVAESCEILGRRGASGTQFQPVEMFYEDQYAVGQADTVLTTSLMTTSQPAAFSASGGTNTCPLMLGIVPPGTLDTTIAGHYWLPRGHEVLAYTAEGLQDDYTIEVTAKLCIEAEVDQTSVFRTMASPVPPLDVRAIEAVEKVSKQLPASIPVPEPTGNWWSTLTSVVGGVGDVLSMAGIPFVSPIAGVVGKIATSLGRLAL